MSMCARASVSLYGQPPMRVGALGQGAGEERLRARRLEDAFLGERAELEVERRLVLALEGQDGLERLEADDGVDLDVAAHGGRAVRDGHVEHAARARPDVLDGEAALGVARHADRLVQRALHALHAIAEERLVEVDVRLDEPGSHGPAVALDDASRGASRDAADFGDAAVATADVQRPPVRQVASPEDEVERLGHLFANASSASSKHASGARTTPAPI